ncbi:hypothetical protein [Caldanaerobius polysaccharolyticus]|uniref:hypothetical protein n=1 Tax=Caldanaerobius polysaccharolyticus TaxID=44256 RepID=UPI0004791142|nr:hypothetical protein [Caldanaerobius polysaccharolyticus]
MKIPGDTLLFFFLLLTIFFDVHFDENNLLFFFLILTMVSKDKPRRKVRRFFGRLLGLELQ